MKRQIIKKWFWVWDFDKEEAWLNDMAQSGWVLDKVGYAKYEFVQCEPGEYTVRLEMLEDAPTAEKSQNYISFVEDLGADYIGSVMKWVYFRKKTADGEFKLFSDLSSQMKHLDGIVKMMAAIALANLLIGVSNMHYGAWGLINIGCAALLGYCCWRIQQKKEKLEKERTLHE